MKLGLLIMLAVATAGLEQRTMSNVRTRATALVQSLAGLPAPRQSRSKSEEFRLLVHAQLREIGFAGVEALALALEDQSVSVRHNALFALYDLGHGVSEKGPVARVDISFAFPALVAAFQDPDASVRSWSIQALTGLERMPLNVIPRLAISLRDSDVGVRLSACAALGQFGPAASHVTQDVQRLLRDQHHDVRNCARFILDKIVK